MGKRAGKPALWVTIVGKPSTFAAAAHTHPISEVVSLQAALDALTGGAAQMKTGNNINFTSTAIYTGALLVDLTGALTFSTVGLVAGVELIIKHNDAAAPAMPAYCKNVTGTIYVPSVTNYIFLKAISTTEVLISYGQE